MEMFIDNNDRFSYPQTLLEECKYIQEKIKIENYVNEDLEDSESDSDNNETESDIDNVDKQFVKSILILIKS